jgi:hypothetical protein
MVIPEMAQISATLGSKKDLKVVKGSADLSTLLCDSSSPLETSHRIHGATVRRKTLALSRHRIQIAGLYLRLVRQSPT